MSNNKNKRVCSRRSGTERAIDLSVIKSELLNNVKKHTHNINERIVEYTQ